jgi:hypothetical protein
MAINTRRVHADSFRGRLSLLIVEFLIIAVTVGCSTVGHDDGVLPERSALVPKWGRFEWTFNSSRNYKNPFQETELFVYFTSPSGDTRTVQAFWDGERAWKVRFSPNEAGKWYFSTSCSDRSNSGLHDRTGTFLCTASKGRTIFEKHGPIRVARDGRHLEHEDGTPFFWLADTAWNGALLSTADEWAFYLAQRKRQKFTAVQWVTTQWRAAPNGNAEGQLAFVGEDEISINPNFFRRLDDRADELNQAGLLNVPVLLWAIGAGSNPQVNPGVSLSADQAVRLARYMVARWGANAVAWILAGDGDYRGEKADRWRQIGRAVFDEPHAPVMIHPGGMHWVLKEFGTEKWLDVQGYQSGHGDDDQTLRWMISGPPAIDWKNVRQPFVNLEPPYENHVAYQSNSRITPQTVRRAVYWSLLSAPTAGVSYGGHGVWGWDNGTKPPTDHPGTGVPFPWQQAVTMPGAEQMAHLASFFNAIDFWRLRPANEILAVQPGAESPRKHIAAAKSERGDLIVLYAPEAKNVDLFHTALPIGFSASWFNPRTGKPEPVIAVVNDRVIQFATPDEGDWVLLITGRAK